MSKILLVIPCAVDAPRGNAKTANRIAKGLASKGHTSCVADAHKEWPGESFDFILALHAAQAGPKARTWAKEHKTPYAILFTGTDLNGKPSADAKSAVTAAKILVAFGNSARKRARGLFGNGLQIEVLPQAPRVLPNPVRDLPDGLLPQGNGAVILIPSGIRAVKNPRRVFEALAPLAKKGEKLRLLFVGPELEAEEGTRLHELLAPHPWAHWAGPVEDEVLAKLYRTALCVISPSKSEGGPPNSLLEAGMASCAVLASDIPAHREFPGRPWLFRSDEELRGRITEWLERPMAAASEGRSLREYTRRFSDPQREAADWDRVIRLGLR